jgi:hypothetical protein
MKPFRAALVAALALAAACGGEGDAADERAGPAAALDTTNADEMDGMSAQQVENQAQAMTPEQAEQAGIVDTTIHVENLQSSDSTPAGVVAPEGNAGPQAAATAAGGRDTVPPRPETMGRPARP